MKQHNKTNTPRKQELNQYLVELGCKVITPKRFKQPKHKKYNKETMYDDEE